ncbi:MAG: hypothetical protein AAGH83_09765 [Pseudomonadota bacterium]
MAYVTITTWELADETDWDTHLHNISTKRLPALKDLGATRVTLIRTSPRTTAAISEWPDIATRNAAANLIDEVRKNVQVYDGSRLTGEMKGEVAADI